MAMPGEEYSRSVKRRSLDAKMFHKKIYQQEDEKYHEVETSALNHTKTSDILAKQ